MPFRGGEKKKYRLTASCSGDTNSKLITTIATTFTSHYIYLWPTYFPDKPLSPPMPSFDGRAVMYPSVQNLRDYMSWRQVDCTHSFLCNHTDHFDAKLFERPHKQSL